jgi:hypothetical protein
MIAVFAEVRADLVSTVGTADERREANLVPGRGGTQRRSGGLPHRAIGATAYSRGQ